MYKISLTGANGSGKTSSIDRIKQELEKKGYNVIVIPESARMLMEGQTMFLDKELGTIKNNPEFGEYLKPTKYMPFTRDETDTPDRWEKAGFKLIGNHEWQKKNFRLNLLLNQKCLDEINKLQRDIKERTVIIEDRNILESQNGLTKQEIEDILSDVNINFDLNGNMKSEVIPDKYYLFETPAKYHPELWKRKERDMKRSVNMENSIKELYNKHKIRFENVPVSSDKNYKADFVVKDVLNYLEKENIFGKNNEYDHNLDIKDFTPFLKDDKEISKGILDLDER